MKVLLIALSLFLGVSGCADEGPRQYYGTLGAHRIKISQDIIEAGPEYDDPKVIGTDPKAFPVMRGWGGYMQLPDFIPPNDANRADMHAAWSNPTSDTWGRYLVRSSSALGKLAKTKPPFQGFRQFYIESWGADYLKKKGDLYGLEVYEPIWKYKNKNDFENVRDYKYTPILYFSRQSNSYIICNRTAPNNTCEHRFFIDQENMVEVTLDYQAHLLKNWAVYEINMRKTIETFYIGN